MKIFESPKAKKAAQIKKNRFHQDLFNFVRLRQLDEERVEALEETRAPKRADKHKKESTSWNKQTTDIRNRLNNKKRQSAERWNRFAGTGGEGGRGL